VNLKQIAIRTPYYVVTGGLAIIFLTPLVWSAVASVSPHPSTNQRDGYGFGNFETLASGGGIGATLPQFVMNSLTVSAMTVVFTLFLAVFAGYAFARFQFPGKNALFLMVLAILMIPPATLLVPMYALMNLVGLSNSLVGVSVFITLFQLPFAIFMMRIAFEAIPVELEESALVDGCTFFGALRRVMLPAAVPGLVTVGLFSFLAAWNDLLAPLMILRDPATYVLPQAVTILRQGVMGTVDFGITQAGVMILALPCVFLFLTLQRYYVKGFMSGALKG